MTEVDDFLSAVLPPLQAADKALHDGDPMPRMALWAREDPLTLFGAARSAAGWTEIERTFEWLAERFSGCDSFEYEVLAAGASGDLAYIAGIERTVASIGGAPPQAYALRVTTVFRREDGRWRVVHRHGDPLPGAEAARDRVAGPGDP